MTDFIEYQFPQKCDFAQYTTEAAIVSLHLDSTQVEKPLELEGCFFFFFMNFLFGTAVKSAEIFVRKLVLEGGWVTPHLSSHLNASRRKNADSTI